MKPSRALALALLFGCAEVPNAKMDGRTSDGKIVYGDQPNLPMHDATVAFHSVSSRGYLDRSPFCTGTLIDERWVLTAAHCVYGSDEGDLVVYIGDDPSVDLASSYWLASDVIVHHSYSNSQLRNDIALVELAEAVTGVAPVPWLPGERGLSSGDAGATVNFAGFGYSESGYGEKLQVYGTVDQVENTTVAYAQYNGGPCNGDSGGPMFLQDGGVWHVAGVTSYGDQQCTQYGVSTKVDAYDDWISYYVGQQGDTGGGDSGSEEPEADANAPAIFNETGEVDGRDFTIAWQTDEAAYSAVVFEEHGAFTESELTTQHEMSFTGNRGSTYTFTIESEDSAGNVGTSGPWQITL